MLDDLRALAALAALLWLPGWVLVRSPWPAVPCLSLAFWGLSWWWLAPLGAERGRFVLGGLLFFALFALLRVVRLGPLVGPARPTQAVAALALATLAPLAWQPLAPGPEAPLRALTVRLLVWRDGLPRTYEPLLPVHAFGADLHAADLLAADVALLSGCAPWRAAQLGALAGQGLVLVALFAWLRRRAGYARPAGDGRLEAGAALAVWGLAAWLWGGLPAAGASEAWGLALWLSAFTWSWEGPSRAPAAAGGLLLAAALALEPWFALLAGPATAAWLLGCARARPSPHSAAWGRLGLLGGTALVSWLPVGAQSGFAPLATPLPTWRALAWTPAHAGALTAVVLAAGLVCAFERWPRAARAWWAGVLLAVAGSGLGAWRHAPRTPPPAAELERLRHAVDAGRSHAVVCIDPDTWQVWLPSLAGSTVEPGFRPRAYRETRAAGAHAARAGGCDVQAPGSLRPHRQSLEK